MARRPLSFLPLLVSSCHTGLYSRRSLDRGTLRAVLQTIALPIGRYNSIYPPTRHLSVKVRLFHSIFWSALQLWTQL